MSRISSVLCTLILLFLATNVVAQQLTYAMPTDPFARDLVVLTGWFEGEFDNEEQLWFQADARSETPEEDRHLRLHTMHTRLDLPEFGEHVFYVEEYKNNNSTDLVRQRFVIFSSEAKQDGIRMRQGFFNKPEEALGAQFDPGKLANLKPEDIFFMDECDVFWKREADQYVGKMRPKSCVFGEGEERRYSVHNLILSADKYWRVDVTRLISNDTIHVGHPEDNPTRMRKAKIFLCDATLQGNDGAIQKIESIRLHSQGGTRVFFREKDGQELEIRIRDKQYPFYNTRPDFLFFSVRKKGEERSIVYTVNDTNSRLFSVSLPDMSFHCHLEGYLFRESIEQLSATSVASNVES